MKLLKPFFMVFCGLAFIKWRKGLKQLIVAQAETAKMFRKTAV